MTSPLWSRLRLGGAEDVVLQSESAECGLACALMVARAFGHELGMPFMRRRFPGSARGSNLRQILEVLAALRIGARALRVDLEGLVELKKPSVLHWNLNHFVVLVRASDDAIEILDPARGRVRMSLDEAGRHFTGVAVETSRLVDFKPEKEEQKRLRLRDLLGSLDRPWRVLGTIVLLGGIVELLSLLLPLFAQWVVDDVVATSDTTLIAKLGIGFMLVALLHSLFLFSRGWLVSWLGASFNNQWSVNTFRHLLSLPWTYFQRRSVGDVMIRFGAIQQIQFTLTSSFIDGLLNGLLSVFILVVLFAYSPLIAMMVAGVFGIYLACRVASLRQLWASNEKLLGWTAREHTLLVESVRGAQSLKMLGAEYDRVLRFANLNSEVIRQNYFIERMSVGFATVAQVLFNLQRIALVWIGGHMIMADSITAGMLVALITYSEQFSSRAVSLVDKLVGLRLLRVQVDRLGDILLSEPEDLGRSRPANPAEQATIELEGVGFRYSESDPWVLRNLDLRIGAGDSVAITGPSGVGKSTLAQIILGLLEPSEGKVRMGGVEPRDIGLVNYRSQFGAVLQNDELFGGSIADNIASFDGAATPERIEDAARKAAIHGDIMAMPMGYETLVGDMGAALSGGQKQRILIARALYRKPRVLVLDEATSHLDARNEALINQAIAGLDVTRIIIAHRAETIASANRVVQLGPDGCKTVREPQPSAASAELA